MIKFALTHIWLLLFSAVVYVVAVVSMQVQSKFIQNCLDPNNLHLFYAVCLVIIIKKNKPFMI